MGTLNYADDGMQKRVSTRWAWRVLALALLLVLAAPAGAAMLRAYYFEYEPAWLSAKVVEVSIWIAAGAAFTAWMYVLGRQLGIRGLQRARRLWKTVPPVLVAMGLLPLCFVTDKYRGLIVERVEARHAEAFDKAVRIHLAIRGAVLDAAAPKSARERSTMYPPHLAEVVARGWAKSTDLVFDGEAAAVPEQLPPAQWRSIAGEIDKHCDFVYVGADLQCDSLLRPESGNAGDLIIAYSREPFFHDGYLVLTVQEVIWVRTKHFPAMWARHNERRKEFFLAEQEFGVAAAAPVRAEGPAADEDRDQRRRRIFAPERGDRSRRGLQCAVLNYAIDHDGYFPPHPAALLAGQYVLPGELLDPTKRTRKYAPDVSQLTEEDWPKIATEVDKCSDFVFACADLRLPGGSWNDAMQKIIVCYSRPVPVDETRVTYLPMGATGALTGSWEWRERWVVSNRARADLGLKPQQPDGVHENPNGKTTPGMVPRGAGYAMEVSRRNAAVIATQLIAQSREAGMTARPTILDMLRDYRISPRHLKDPSSGTAMVKFGDNRLPSHWESGAIWEAMHSDYMLVDANLDLINSRSSLPVVYSRNDFGGTGRIVGYADGSAKFVEKKNIVDGVEPVGEEQNILPVKGTR